MDVRMEKWKYKKCKNGYIWRQIKNRIQKSNKKSKKVNGSAKH